MSFSLQTRAGLDAGERTLAKALRNSRIFHHLSSVCLFTALVFPASLFPADFDSEIRPLLQEHCVECHGVKKQKGELRLDAKVHAFKGGHDGPAIVAGKADASPLFQRITSTDDDERMPPKGEPLSTQQMANIKAWIEDGAAWPENEADKAAAVDKRGQHWSVQPVWTDFPKDASVDSFIRATLKAKGLAMSPEADRRTLIRRLSFDLHGLPPTPERVERFVKDADPRADFMVFVEAEQKFQKLKLRKDETAALDVEVSASAKTLTLIATDGGDGIGTDLLFVGDPKLAAEAGDKLLTEADATTLKQLSAPEATDLRGETDATKKLYALDHEDISPFGRQCLLARRLVERGVRFVQIYCGAENTTAKKVRPNWDSHEDIVRDHGYWGPVLDTGAAALLTDLKSRGLLDSALVICTGEFGRQPGAQGKGRDHNPGAFTAWMAGGGIRGGAAYGSTDDLGFKGAENPAYCYDHHATALHLLGLDHEKLSFYNNGIARRLKDVHGHVIKEIVA